LPLKLQRIAFYEKPKVILSVFAQHWNTSLTRWGLPLSDHQKSIANEDATQDDGSDSSYAPEEREIQSTLAREPPPKVPRFTSTIARKSAPSQAPLRNNSFLKTSTPEETPTPKAPPRSAKRSAEDEILVMKQQDLTKKLKDVEHELEVMDA
jgi:hypothetical protein